MIRKSGTVPCYNSSKCGGIIPPEVRQLKATLAKAGFSWRPGKGSHAVWVHPVVPELEVTISGQDGHDAKPYQERDVRDALKYLERKKHEH